MPTPSDDGPLFCQKASARVVFMGSPAFALPSLQALSKADSVKLVAVYTQPPRPKHRGHQVEPTAVHQLAQAWEVPVLHPTSLKSQQAQEQLAAFRPDVIVVAAYGLLLPQAVLDIPPLGCVNVHASLLPRWRGAAPIQRALLEGDRLTGISLMKMEAGLDTGPVFAMQSTPIQHHTTFLELHDTLAQMGAELLKEHLPPFLLGRRPLCPQPEEEVTYAAKVEKAEGRLDWTLPAHVLERHIRALNPSPGTWCCWKNKRLKILKAAVEPTSGPPGQVLDGRFLIGCGENSLRPLQMVPQGGKTQELRAFLNGNTSQIGDAMGLPL